MKNQTRKFWLVWCVGGGTARVQHTTLAAAKIEAARLARDHSGQTFAVLESVCSVCATDLTWAEATEDPPPPF